MNTHLFCNAPGAKEEFAGAERFLQDILNELGLARRRVVMCPGNHDADTDEAHSSFHHYEEFCANFYKSSLSSPDVESGNFSFVSMNTCCETSLELYEHATLQEEDCRRLRELPGRKTGVLLLHHPPETIINQELFEEVMASGKIQLILSGHQHMSQPRLYKAGEITVVSGMAITPHRNWMAAGAQIININENGEVEATQINL